MIKKLWFLTILVLLLVFGMTIFGCNIFNPENNNNNNNENDTSLTVPDRYEYTSINAMVFGRMSNNGMNVLMERANELGEDGWELVSASKADTGFTDRNLIILFFKRKLP